LSVLQLS